jgi:hypothetical protein
VVPCFGEEDNGDRGVGEVRDTLCPGTKLTFWLFLIFGKEKKIIIIITIINNNNIKTKNNKKNK